MSRSDLQKRVEQIKRERAQHIRLGMESDPQDARHGTEYAQYGCSCARCVAWRKKREREARRGNKKAVRARADRLQTKGENLKPMWAEEAKLDRTKLETHQPLFSTGSKAKRHSSYCS